MRITSPPYASCNSFSPAARSRPRMKSRKSLSAMWAGAVCSRSLTPKTNSGPPNTGKCRGCLPRISMPPPAVPRRMPTTLRKPSSGACIRDFPASALAQANLCAFWSLRRASATSSASAPNSSMRTFLPLNLIPRPHPSRNIFIHKRSISISAFKTAKSVLTVWMP